jgi:hypothetical protein
MRNLSGTKYRSSTSCGHVHSLPHGGGTVHDGEFLAKVFALAPRRDTFDRKRVVVPHRQTDHIKPTGHGAAVVLVEIVGRVGGRAQVCAVLIAVRLGALAVADVVEAIFKLLAGNRRVVAEILRRTFDLTEQIVFVAPVTAIGSGVARALVGAVVGVGEGVEVEG